MFITTEITLRDKGSQDKKEYKGKREERKRGIKGKRGNDIL